MRSRTILTAAVLVAALAGCSDISTQVNSSCTAPRVTIPALSGDTVATSSGLKYLVRSEGTGTTAQAASTVTVNYIGYLPDGTLFDRGQGIEFPLRGVIPGFAEGITGMRVGGARRLIIPPNLAYGPNSPGACIPPNSTLIFDVELVAVQ
jgi:FKBP-type peptidyl-prolyl cis-trans isomerase